MPRLALLEHDDEVMFCGDFAAARLKSAGALTESYMGMAPVPCGAGAGEIAAGAVAPGADEASGAGCCTRPVRMGVRSAPGAGQRLPGCAHRHVYHRIGFRVPRRRRVRTRGDEPPLRAEELGAGPREHQTRPWGHLRSTPRDSP